MRFSDIPGHSATKQILINAVKNNQMAVATIASIALGAVPFKETGMKSFADWKPDHTGKTVVKVRLTFHPGVGISDHIGKTTGKELVEHGRHAHRSLGLFQQCHGQFRPTWLVRHPLRSRWQHRCRHRPEPLKEP